MKIIGLWALRLFPLLIFLTIWQVLANRSQRTQFLFASPELVLKSLFTNILNGELLLHTSITGLEAFAGFILGVIIGSLIGFGLLYSPLLTAISKPYVLALGSVPVFALAPMLIVWFGIEFKMKVAMAFFSTVLVALSQAYEGGKNVDPELKALFEMNLSSRKAMFWKLTFPSSVDWVLASLKLNIGLALLGAFIGEFIASEGGLGHVILKAGGIYNVPYVLAAAICIIALAFGLNFLVSLIEKHRRKLIELTTVPRLLRLTSRSGAAQPGK